MMAQMLRAIGLMSGTSLDGVDAALLATDGDTVERTGHALTLPYDDTTRDALRGCFGGAGDVPLATRLLTEKHAEAVSALLSMADVAAGDVDVIGFHGQTIVHRPAEGLTWQIGDGARLAAMAGIDVVCGFRSRDMAAGGEGAPLAPLYHAALVRGIDESPIAVLNIGGVANVTWIDGSRIIAFDTGPGGALLDDWVAHRTGDRFDQDGALAATGRVHDKRVEAILLDEPYFRRDPPKSLDRDAFRVDLSNLSTPDGAATLVALTAEAVSHARGHMPADPACWIVCGGGRHNDAVMAALRERLGSPVKPAEEVGWDGDSLEAEAFAYLAVRSLHGMPLSLP
ncbi:MAG: anhydro-N-acetylmuramic acid kinase, partial [Rhodospirillaceae bacterium]|nr:anhydro-N-acetylmuramic acid kinase [Rhodospirillaceae bacterium]